MKITCLAYIFLSFGSDFKCWHVARLNQVDLPYAIIYYLDLLLQGQVIYNLKRKYSTSRHASLDTPVFSINKTRPSRYNRHIVESGVKHHRPKPINMHVHWLLLHYLNIKHDEHILLSLFNSAMPFSYAPLFGLYSFSWFVRYIPFFRTVGLGPVSSLASSE